MNEILLKPFLNGRDIQKILQCSPSKSCRIRALVRKKLAEQGKKLISNDIPTALFLEIMNYQEVKKVSPTTEALPSEEISDNNNEPCTPELTPELKRLKKECSNQKLIFYVEKYEREMKEKRAREKEMAKRDNQKNKMANPNIPLIRSSNYNITAKN